MADVQGKQTGSFQNLDKAVIPHTRVFRLAGNINLIRAKCIGDGHPLKLRA